MKKITVTQFQQGDILRTIAMCRDEGTNELKHSRGEYFVVLKNEIPDGDGDLARVRRKDGNEDYYVNQSHVEVVTAKRTIAQLQGKYPQLIVSPELEITNSNDESLTIQINAESEEIEVGCQTIGFTQAVKAATFILEHCK